MLQLYRGDMEFKTKIGESGGTLMLYIPRSANLLNLEKGELVRVRIERISGNEGGGELGGKE